LRGVKRLEPFAVVSAGEERRMNEVTSDDGTIIEFDLTGEGPPVILICGGSVTRMADAPLASELERDFTVFNYDRRGRGDSGDTLPYAIEREIEDIAALIDEAGGSSNVWGSSSGAVLGLRAAAAGLPMTKLALWEPPFIPEGVPRPPEDQVEQYERMVAEDRRGDAVEYFMTKVVGLPAEFAANARTQPWWGPTEAIAHTLAYDARIMGDYRISLDLVGSTWWARSRSRRSWSPAARTCPGCATPPRRWQVRSRTARRASSTAKATTST
jgi:hypothetical protein